MALNRDKFRRIVGGITTSESESEAVADADQPATEIAKADKVPPEAGQGSEIAVDAGHAEEAKPAENRRFAKRGRPKSNKDEEPAGKGRKIKVSLFLSEALVNDLYDWAHHDRIHPGEMFERALKPFHERELKRRKGGKE